MVSKFAKKALIICAALITLNPAMGDGFKNSVINLKLDKDASNNIKVTIVTSKPYSCPVYVNKKANNQYTILLPDTQNAMNTKPIIDKISGIVSGVSISTQPGISEECKGYTKITITALHPVNITATTSMTMNTAVKNEPQHINKTASHPAPVKQQTTTAKAPVQHTQAHKIAANPTVKPIVIPAVKPQVQKTTAKPTAAAKPQVQKTAAKPTAAVKPQAQKTAAKSTAAVKPQVQKTAAKSTAAVKPQVQKTAAKSTAAVKPQAQKTTAKPTAAVKPQAQKTTAKPTAAAKPQVQKTAAKPTAAVKPQAQKTTAKPTAAAKPQVQKQTANKIQQKSKPKTVANQIKNETAIPATKTVLKEQKLLQKETAKQAQERVQTTKKVQNKKNIKTKFDNLVSKIKINKSKKTDTKKETKLKKKSENSYFKKLITQITSKQDKNIKTKQVEENQLTSSWNSLISQVKLRNNLVRLLLVLSAIGFPLIVIFMIVALNRNIKKKIDESLKQSNSENKEEYAVKSESGEDTIDTKTQTSFADYMHSEEDSTQHENIEEYHTSVLEKETEQQTEDAPDETTEEIVEDSEQLTEDVKEDTAEEIVEETEQLTDDAPDETTEEIVEDSEQLTEDVQEDTAEEIVEDSEQLTEDVKEETAEEIVEDSEQLTEDVQDETEEEIVEETEQQSEDVPEDTAEEPTNIEEQITEEDIINTNSDDITEDEFEYFDNNADITPTEDTITDDMIEIINETSSNEEYTPDGYINDFEDYEDDDSIFDELRNNTIDFNEDDEPEINLDDEETEEDNSAETSTQTISENQDNEEKGEYETTVDGLTVLTQTPIDNVSGFYLVNFENFSSLIGYIKDEIFVLKTFDEFVNNNIYIKPAEHLKESVFRYIVRVGIYKMVVEVTPTKMSHLIDL